MRLWRPLVIPAAGYALIMWVTSIASGWHYATDGIVGAAFAAAIYAWLCRRNQAVPYRPASRQAPSRLRRRVGLASRPSLPVRSADGFGVVRRPPTQPACGGRRGSRQSRATRPDTSDQRIGAAIGMNSCALVHQPCGLDEQRGALARRRASRGRSASSGSASSTQIAATPQRNRRRNQAGEEDGATSSIQTRSAEAALGARSTLMPSGPQS